MYKDLYGRSSRVEVSFTQLLIIAGVVFVFLVLPIHLISTWQYQQANPSNVYTAGRLQQQGTPTQGKVAGMSDTTGEDAGLIRIPFTAVFINLQSEAGVLTVAGLVLVSVGLITIIYLLVSGERKQRARAKY